MEMDGVQFREAVAQVAEWTGKEANLSGPTAPQGPEDERKRRIAENRRKICVGLRNWHKNWAIHWAAQYRLAQQTVDFTHKTYVLALAKHPDHDHYLVTESARSHALAQGRMAEYEYLAEQFATDSHDIGRIGRLFAEHYAKAKL